MFDRYPTNPSSIAQTLRRPSVYASVAGSLTVLSLLSGITIAAATPKIIPHPTLARSIAQSRTLLASNAIAASASISPSKSLAKITPIPASSNADIEAGRAAYRSGDFKTAVTQWQRAADRLEAQGDTTSQAMTLNYLALAHQELNQWDAAKDAINLSLKILRNNPKTEAQLWAQVLNTQAGLQLQTGQAETALTIWQQAQKYYIQAQDPIGAIGVQINQAQALQSLGFYRRAKSQLEGLNRKLADMPDSDVKIAGFRNLGTVLQVIGDMTGSQSALEEAVIISRRLKSSTELSASLLSLSDSTLHNGREEMALRYLQEAESIAMNPLEKAQAQLGQLNLYLNQGNLKEVSARLPNVRSSLLALPPSRMSIYSIVNLAANLNRLQKPEDVVSLKEMAGWLAQATQSARQLQDRDAEAYALHQLGQVYIQTKQWSEAQQVTEQSLAIAQQMDAQHIISQSAWQLGQVLHAKGDRSRSLQAYQEAVNALQALRGDLVAINPEIQFSFRESVEPVYREMVDILLTEKPSQGELIQARGLIEALQVAELDNFFREACLDKGKQIDQLDPTATVVYPILLKERVAVIVSTSGQPVKYHSSPRDNKQVSESLNGMLAAINPVSDRKQHLKISSQIYDWLIRPAEEAGALKDTKTLVFVLDGKLRNIPMAALYDGKQYLIEKYAVTLSTGLQLMETRQLDNKNISAIIGGISEGRAGFAALPEVKSEIQQISNLVSSRTLLNEQFTSVTLSDRLSNSGADVIHLATHGQFSSRLDDTFLLTWDGRMNIKELSEVLQNRQSNRSRPIELLVLSACDTAAGDDQAALGLAGLAVKSGARSTLATLWPVKDVAAAKLMARFYGHLRQPGMNKAEALRLAQIELMKQTDFNDPFFWSGFVLVGNWR